MLSATKDIPRRLLALASDLALRDAFGSST